MGRTALADMLVLLEGREVEWKETRRSPSNCYAAIYPLASDQINANANYVFTACLLTDVSTELSTMTTLISGISQPFAAFRALAQAEGLLHLQSARQAG